MKIENTTAQMRKGVLEFCILSILKNGEAYPSDILSRLKKVNLIVVEGTLYPLLTRKYYVLTPAGEAFLKELGTTWKDLVKAVKQATKKL